MVDASTMVDNTNYVYNNLAVNPVSGEVVLNTIGDYKNYDETNNISFFDFSGSEPKLSANYIGHTRFPAGIFFTYNFE